MPLQRRLPKRGFTNVFKKEYAIVNVRDLARVASDATLDPDAFQKSGLVKKIKDGIKLLGSGDLNLPVVVRVHRASKVAREKVEAAGGRVEII